MKRLLQVLGLRRREKTAPNAARYAIRVPSTMDGHRQSCLFIPSTSDVPRPLLVYLHPWRHGYDFDSVGWQEEAKKRGWHFIAPHFRGPNKRPEACASRLARQDVLDAVDYVIGHAAVDLSRVYLGGVSGGGHMALVMATERPDRWAAVSAWCPITNLAAFYRECVAMGSKTHRHIEKVAGGGPGSSRKADGELRYRSPVFHMSRIGNLPVDISHGIRDGQPRGIGIQHSVWAFNALAASLGGDIVPEEDLTRLQAWQTAPVPAEKDEVYGRAIHLRKRVGRSRLTIFEGGHEDLPGAACTWMEQYRRTL